MGQGLQCQVEPLVLVFVTARRKKVDRLVQLEWVRMEKVADDEFMDILLLNSAYHEMEKHPTAEVK